MGKCAMNSAGFNLRDLDARQLRTLPTTEFNYKSTYVQLTIKVSQLI
jgi:hypothetical protein